VADKKDHGPARPGFWAADSIIAVSLWALLPFVYAVLFWPVPIDHPGVRAAMGADTYAYGEGPPEVQVFAEWRDREPDPEGISFELPDGRKANASVRFQLEPYGPDASLTLLFNNSDPDGRRAVVDVDAVRLTDTSGFQFPLEQLPNGPAVAVFKVTDNEAINRLRFNEPSYYLSLVLPFQHGGLRSITIDKIHLRVGAPMGHADTPVSFVAPLFGMVVLFFLPAYLIGRAWGRARLAAKDAAKDRAG
jgi:hypothetical protein